MTLGGSLSLSGPQPTHLYLEKAGVASPKAIPAQTVFKGPSNKQEVTLPLHLLAGPCSSFQSQSDVDKPRVLPTFLTSALSPAPHHADLPGALFSQGLCTGCSLARNTCLAHCSFFSSKTTFSESFPAQARSSSLLPTPTTPWSLTISQPCLFSSQCPSLSAI